jgi:DNA-directed RNA polymerase I, II, and III subunit RPABC2
MSDSENDDNSSVDSDNSNIVAKKINDDDSDYDDIDDINGIIGENVENIDNVKISNKILEIDDTGSEYSESSVDSDNYDENYLQKFENNTSKNIINEYYPELIQHNNEEIETLSNIVRNNGIIIDPLHKTIPFLTKYEKTRILGERTKQLELGANPFIDIENNVLDCYVIALKELEQKKIPFTIKRPIPDGSIEYWKVKDLEFL